MNDIAALTICFVTIVTSVTTCLTADKFAPRHSEVRETNSYDVQRACVRRCGNPNCKPCACAPTEKP